MTSGETETGFDGLDDRDEQAWYGMPVSEVTTELGVDVASGLDAGQAGRRLGQVGPNELAEAARRGPWRVFGDQFRNLLIIILMVAAVVAGLIGDFKDAIIIVAVLVFNAVLGFYQEYRAERSLDALKRMLVAQARVRRAGEQVIVPATELVPGDVVLLEAGDRVPADGRIAVASSAEVDESSLTGESVPVVKGVEPVTGDVVPLADRTNMAFMNTVVTRGRLELVVTDTGMRTQMGELARMLESAGSGPTPLQVQLNALGARLAIVAGIAVAVFFSLELLRGESLSGTLLNSVALAVAAIPEGLPAVVTVTLSVGTYALARRGAIVKQLASVETLGCTSVICSDKTGTLTVNQMTARRMYAAGSWFDISGEGYGNDGDIRPRDPEPAGSNLHDLARSAVLCSDSVITDGQLIGDPTEGALLTLARKAGMDVEATRRAIPRLAEVPFDSSAKFMATFHDVDGRSHVLAKGAWEALLPRATQAAQGAGTQRLTDDVVAVWTGAAEEMARSGLRVLALASAEMPEGSDPAALDNTERSLAVSGLTLLGLVGLLDPPRPEARVAIARCASAGIAVKMITGDHGATAQAIAADLAIPGEVITGAELDRLDDDQLRARIDDLGVFARVAPEHKVRIVTALQDHQRVVAMTGDGVNDAPALKSADIGVAMGVTGTEVSKEAAAMVLTDDNFATIVGAVEQGRTIYDNIVKFVRFQLSTNLGAILAMVGAPLVGLPVPFAAIQVLWVNLIMDGPPAMALGVDPPQPGVMEAQPRSPSARILTPRRLFHLLGFGAIMAGGTLGVLSYGLTVTSEAEALTMAFTTFVFYQVFNVFNARNERESAFGRHTLTNNRLWLALALVVALQVAAVQVPALHGAFKTTDLSAAGWVTAIVVASSILLAEELRKLVLRHMHVGHPPR